MRRLLGRWETPVADAYRAVFIDLDHLTGTLAGLGTPTRILEIGCGDGSVADRLCTRWPSVGYLSIDIAAEPGRRFSGDRSRATFRSTTSGEVHDEQFDLVLVVDVLHHIPTDAGRVAVLADAQRLTAGGGTIAVKEWVRGGPFHAAAFASDRYISGDRGVRFTDPDELGVLLDEGLSECDPVMEYRVAPRKNNLLRAFRRR